MTPKPTSNKQTSRIAITTMMMVVVMTLLLVTPAYVFVPAKATIIDEERNGDTDDEERNGDTDDEERNGDTDDDDGTVAVTFLDCVSSIPPNNFVALSNCIASSIFDDDFPPSDPCDSFPPEFPGC
jgi:hypothetical protein